MIHIYENMRYRRGNIFSKPVQWLSGLGQRFQEVTEEVDGRGRILAKIPYPEKLFQCARPDTTTSLVSTGTTLIQHRSQQP